MTLDPDFNGGATNYVTATANATNTITATAAKSGAKVTIKVNDEAHTNGAAATWGAGENTVEITVKYGTTQRVYTVTVTKTS